MWDLDDEAAQKLLGDLSQDPDFQYAEVTDPKGKVLFSYGENADEMSLTTSISPIQHVEGDQTEVIGTLSLSLSHHSLNSVKFLVIPADLRLMPKRYLL